MPGHYGDKKKNKRGSGAKKVPKGLAALAKKRPKVAAAIMKNKKKRPKYKQLELPLAKYGGKNKFKNDPRTKPNV